MIPLEIVESTLADQPSAGRARRLPTWLRVQLPAGMRQHRFNHTTAAVDENRLHTVCEEARCPNIHDCWSRGTATFMIAGDTCTRGCRFCSVKTERAPSPPDVDEPEHLAAAVQRMGLSHAVITVVNRDDLPDGGAAHYRRCVDAVRARTPSVSIELLCSDLAGNEEALQSLLKCAPIDVFAHNVECVPRLDSLVRDPRASFQTSIRMLRRTTEYRPELFTKSSLMVGLGEMDSEVVDAMRVLREAGVQLLTIGQYLTPGKVGDRFLPVERYVPPEQFELYELQAEQLGFAGVACGPLVRSSFRAGELLARARKSEVDTNGDRPL